MTDEASHVPTQTLAIDLGQIAGSEFGKQHLALIPPFLGPMASSPGLPRILDSSPFEQNVMLITRFPKSPEDHFATLIPKLRRAVGAHGLVLQVASDSMAEDTLWANVVTYMWTCKYAIVLMDTAEGVLNSNVLIEIGGMLMTGRRCAILRDTSVPHMPSDLVAHMDAELRAELTGLGWWLDTSDLTVEETVERLLTKGLAAGLVTKPTSRS